MHWFLYARDLRHESVNALLLACINRDIFLDYDKIIDIYASKSKYPGRMLLMNLLVQILNARKTYETYIDFNIFSLHFIVEICKNFHFASTVHYYKLRTVLMIKLNVIYAHFASKANWFVLCSLRNCWNYFWKKYCNLSFLAICRSQLPFWYFLRHPDIKKQKLRYEWACEVKKIWLIIILKGNKTVTATGLEPRTT